MLRGMTNASDDRDSRWVPPYVPQHVTRAQLLAAVTALGIDPADVTQLHMDHRDGVTITVRARDTQGQIIAVGGCAAEAAYRIPLREYEPGECPPACADGHMYDGHCAVDPYAGLPESAGIASNDFPRDRWAWRCWGTDGCDGWVSLDHSSPAAARRAYDRHAKAEHGQEAAR